MEERFLSDLPRPNTWTPERAQPAPPGPADVRIKLPSSHFCLTVSRHSLKEIESLLRKEKTKSILQEMDDATLQGSPSIPYLEFCNMEAEEDPMKVLFLEPLWCLTEPNTTPENTKLQTQRQTTTPAPDVQQEELLIDLNDPQIYRPSNEQPLSPALEQMRMLDSRFDSTDTKDSAAVTVTSAEKEKHDSVHSVDGTRELWETKRVAANLSPSRPVSSEPKRIHGLDRSSSTASAAESSRIFASFESELSEAVIMDSRVDPFPVIVKPPPLLPLHWKEEEVDLEARRSRVLKSGNVDDQLDFAELALHFCTIARHHNIRKSRLQKVPVEETHVQQNLYSDAKQIVTRLAQSDHAKALFLQSTYFEADQSKVCELQKAALANRYYRAAFYLGNMLEMSKVTKKALGYYVEGAAGGDSACQSVSLPYSSLHALLSVLINTGGKNKTICSKPSLIF